jgi:hypothetical protein
VATITIKLDHQRTMECLRLMWQVCGEAINETLSGDEALDELLRLSGIIRAKHGYVPVALNEDWRTAGRAGAPWMSPTPTEALCKHLAAIGIRARLSSGAIGQIDVAHSS